ncbi:MAG: ParB/RepB/Spo0J family partition protein [Clostridiaceae bacterium]|nr:ParB/RepB/Spo0J family partition protein [Clostridiaceae bacterium]
MAEKREQSPARSKRGLGRGLGAIFETEPGLGQQDETQVIELNINRLEPNRDQPRQDFDQDKLLELAASIADQGVISPLIVTPSQTPEHYMIVAGERRWRAARLAGLQTVPVIVRELTKDAIQRQALIDNVVREDLNALEEAVALNHLIKEYAMTQEDLATALGKSRSAIANTLRLLNLPPEIQELVRKGELSPGHARAILALTGAAEQSRAASEVLARHLSVRDTEKLVRDFNDVPTKRSKKPSVIDSKTQLHIRSVEDKLRRALGTRVTLDGGHKQGKIVIRYHSAAELEGLLNRLLQNDN